MRTASYAYTPYIYASKIATEYVLHSLFCWWLRSTKLLLLYNLIIIIKRFQLQCKPCVCVVKRVDADKIYGWSECWCILYFESSNRFQVTWFWVDFEQLTFFLFQINFIKFNLINQQSINGLFIIWANNFIQNFTN